MHMLLVLKPQLNHVPLMLKTTTTTSACFPDLKTCNTMPALLVLKTNKKQMAMQVLLVLQYLL